MPSDKCHTRDTSMDERNLIHPELGLLAKSKAVSRSEADKEQRQTGLLRVRST